MTDDIDIEALIAATASTMRIAGVGYLEAMAQVRDIFTEAWNAAAIYEFMLADLDPPSDALH